MCRESGGENFLSFYHLRSLAIKLTKKTKKEGRLVEALFVALGSYFNFGGF